MTLLFTIVTNTENKVSLSTCQLNKYDLNDFYEKNNEIYLWFISLMSFFRWSTASWVMVTTDLNGRRDRQSICTLWVSSVSYRYNTIRAVVTHCNWCVCTNVDLSIQFVYYCSNERPPHSGHQWSHLANRCDLQKHFPLWKAASAIGCQERKDGVNVVFSPTWNY